MRSQTDLPNYTDATDKNPTTDEKITPVEKHADNARAFVVAFKRANIARWRIMNDKETGERVTGDWGIPGPKNYDVVTLRPEDDFGTLDGLIAERLFIKTESDKRDPTLTYKEMRKSIGINTGKILVWTDRKRRNGADALRLLWQTDGQIEVLYCNERAPSLEEQKRQERPHAGGASESKWTCCIQ